eukprot:2836621-Pleurochrysis_carterae.AAC.1
MFSLPRIVLSINSRSSARPSLARAAGMDDEPSELLADVGHLDVQVVVAYKGVHLVGELGSERSSRW